jgi:DNA gyrase subunit B
VAIDDPSITVEARNGSAETLRLVIVRTHHGTKHASTIDGDLLASGDFSQIRTAAAVLLGLIGAGATVRRGDKVQAIKSFKEAIDWLLADARGSISLQRYKGLGE